MREKNRKPIASIKKLPQFTTMNVIDGQAGLVNYSSLIFYSLTIDNILNIIVLLILAGVTIATLTGENGVLTRATEAREETAKKGLKEEIELAVGSNNIGDRVDGSGNLEEELNEINGATVGKVAEDAYYVERDGNGYTVYEDGTIEEGKVDVWDGQTIEKPEVDDQGNWHIYTTGQMKFFAKYCSNELTEEEKTEANMPEITETTTVYLENNLDMGARQKDGELVSGTQWTSVRDFNGIFEGNNHSISGIFIKGRHNSDGLFEVVIGKFQNLTIKNSYIETTAQRVGGIAGANYGEVINCHNVNTTVKSSMDSSVIGGVVGLNWGVTISGCTNTGEISGKKYVGGIAGYNFNDSQIENCINSGKITGDLSVGGITGRTFTNTSITNSYNEGEVIGTAERIGGIAGEVQGTSGTIENNYNKGTVRGVTKVGGIIGKNAETFVVTKCYNKGTVEGTTNVGSVIGEQLNRNDNLSKLYYLNTLNLGGVNGEDITDKVIGVNDDINSYGDFLTWIASK